MSEETAPDKEKRGACCSELTLAYWILRLWLGLRLLTSGIEKFKVRGETEYNMEAYQGFMAKAGGPIWENTLMPEALVKAFMFPLGFVMIGAGLGILLGFLNRLCLFIGGLIFVSLSVGMGLLPDAGQTLSLGLYVALFAGALTLVKHNRLAITRW